jgi:intermediate peptidase
VNTQQNLYPFIGRRNDPDSWTGLHRRSGAPAFKISLLPPTPFMLLRRVLSRPTKQIFHFRACQRLQPPSRQLHTGAPLAIPASADDLALVSLFDQPRHGLRTSLSSTGLFGHPALTHPHALISLANATLVRAQILTNRILRAQESRSELLKVVKNLDRLSDMLCGVIDLAELVRNAHPDRMWADAANHAYEILCEYMNVLNTHVGLYEVRESSICASPSFTIIFRS